MSKDFIKQRIAVFTGQEIDLNSDAEVVSILNRKFNIQLPQRPSLNKALEECISDHEIIDLLIQYRTE